MPDVSAMLNHLWAGITNPVELFGHFTYFLLIVSMLMRRMVWLRALAVASGVTKIVYRAFFVLDPVSVLWETIFVIVNAAQLAIIWYDEYHHRFTEEGSHFAASMPQGVERSAVRRLLDYADLRRFGPGDVLTQQGESVRDLMYIADGIVKVEAGERVVAICGPGDYIGELSFLSGNRASATATVVKPSRILAFDQLRLAAAIDADPMLRRTLESALNRNLAGKLTRANSSEPVTG